MSENVERPVAVWRKRNDALHTMECSNCGADAHYQIVDGVWRYEPYCAHCGARVYKQEDLPMSEEKKPRLAEVLGVDVNEEFDFVGGGFTHCCYVDSNGWLRYKNGETCDTDAVFLINNPQYIRRKPHWTEQEVEDAKTILRMLPSAKYIINYGEDDMCIYDDDNCLLTLPEGLFPSLSIGGSVDIADIIGGNK